MAIRLLALLILCSSCTARGYLYTSVVKPYCKDMRSTKVGTKTGKGAFYQVKIPTSNFDLTTQWNSKAIGDIARANNIETIYFCDQKLVSVLGGIYKKEQIIVYGD